MKYEIAGEASKKNVNKQMKRKPSKHQRVSDKPTEISLKAYKLTTINLFGGNARSEK